MREYVLNAAKGTKQPVVLRAMPYRAPLEHYSRSGTKLKRDDNAPVSSRLVWREADAEDPCSKRGVGREDTGRPAHVATIPSTRVALLAGFTDDNGDVWGIRRSATQGVDIGSIHLPTLLKVLFDELKLRDEAQRKFLGDSEQALESMPPDVREAAELLLNWVDTSL